MRPPESSAKRFALTSVGSIIGLFAGCLSFGVVEVPSRREDRGVWFWHPRQRPSTRRDEARTKQTRLGPAGATAIVPRSRSGNNSPIARVLRDGAGAGSASVWRRMPSSIRLGRDYDPFE